MEYGRAIIVDDLASLSLQEPSEAAAAIYDRAIGLRLLHQDRDSGEEHYLIRYPAGTKGRVHRHTASHADATPGCGWEGLFGGGQRRLVAEQTADFGDGARQQARTDSGCGAPLCGVGRWWPVGM
ncbi:MAG TPA: hypothetical protein VHM23_13950 [Actinomycetota bacterium]|jgi:hypothetical protein|nr:hypothetical protein [Actinomycetota bacterium]